MIFTNKSSVVFDIIAKLWNEVFPNPNIEYFKVDKSALDLFNIFKKSLAS